eukprot:COSAG02_NODE_79_length_40228_cov_18.435762_15_plen_108_part_00
MGWAARAVTGAVRGRRAGADGAGRPGRRCGGTAAVCSVGRASWAASTGQPHVLLSGVWGTREMANFSLIWRSRGRILTHSMHADLISESHLILICMLQKVPLAATIR